MCGEESYRETKRFMWAFIDLYAALRRSAKKCELNIVSGYDIKNW